MSTTDSRFRPDVIAALRDVYMHDEEIRVYLAPTIAATKPGPMHEDTAWMDRIPVQTWTTAARLWRAVREDQPDPTRRGRARVVGHDVPTWIMPDLFEQVRRSGGTFEWDMQEIGPGGVRLVAPGLDWFELAQQHPEELAVVQPFVRAPDIERVREAWEAVAESRRALEGILTASIDKPGTFEFQPWEMLVQVEEGEATPDWARVESILGGHPFMDPDEHGSRAFSTPRGWMPRVIAWY